MSTRCDYVPGLAPDSMLPLPLLERLAIEKILAVVTLDRAEDAAPLACALLDGGVRAIELAWRSADALAALAVIKQAAPEILLGVGTLLTAEQVRLAREAGADFGVSPGLSPAVVHPARTWALPYAPGVQTASDIQAAVEHGCRCLKFFPAEPAGGLAHLRHLYFEGILRTNFIIDDQAPSEDQACSSLDQFLNNPAITHMVVVRKNPRLSRAAMRFVWVTRGSVYFGVRFRQIWRDRGTASWRVLPPRGPGSARKI